MEVKLIEALDPTLPTYLFLTQENLSQLLALIPEPVRKALESKEKAADADASFSYRTPEFHLEAYGLGAEAALEPEKLRKTLHGAIGQANHLKYKNIQLAFTLVGEHPKAEYLVKALGEIPVLSNYQFLAYKSEKKHNTLLEAGVYTNHAQKSTWVSQATAVAKATTLVRDLVNEPPNVLTAEELARRAKDLGEQWGFGVEVWDKARIHDEHMGGLLAVNRGSQDPPTYTILTWKPEGAPDEKPLILVGKGVVFDTGGLSLKPTASSMDYMKCDMAGAGAVIGAFVALAATGVKRHVIGLMPATDNRPGENAYTPNDVVTMMDGSTVEVLNTDAEGRMILADALHHAKQFKPQLVISLATLTGSAAAAIGSQGAVAFSNADDSLTEKLLASGFLVHERLVRFPLWADYSDMLKSDIADRKNIGGPKAGAITAAKFLEHFTDYPYVHLDIAAPAWNDKPDDYRGKNGTGWAVRLLHDFISHLA
jgi:leucyl aminopeptidase